MHSVWGVHAMVLVWRLETDNSVDLVLSWESNSGTDPCEARTVNHSAVSPALILPCKLFVFRIRVSLLQ